MTVTQSLLSYATDGRMDRQTAAFHSALGTDVQYPGYDECWRVAHLSYMYLGLELVGR